MNGRRATTTARGESRTCRRLMTGASFAAALCLAVLTGCTTPQVNRNRPMSMDRGEEVLEFRGGEAPRWRKRGNVKVRHEGEGPAVNLNETITVADDGAIRTVDARGRKVAVTGDDVKIVVTGGCSSLVVTGSNNRIQCDFAGEIEIPGSGNDVAFGSVTRGSVRGDNNTLSWREPADDLAPEIDFIGINNLLERKAE